LTWIYGESWSSSYCSLHLEVQQIWDVFAGSVVYLCIFSHQVDSRCENFSLHYYWEKLLKLIREHTFCIWNHDFFTLKYLPAVRIAFQVSPNSSEFSWVIIPLFSDLACYGFDVDSLSEVGCYKTWIVLTSYARLTSTLC
jgi:hypothetical protein